MVNLHIHAEGVYRSMFESGGKQKATDNRTVSLKILNMLMRNHAVLK